MTSGSPSSKFSVLVVDDDPRVLRSVEMVLSDDVEVTACDSPERALELLRRKRFHVICSDYQMPGMNGLQLLARVAELDELTGCLLLTGSDEYRSAESTRHYVLLKPFDPERLIALVLQLARVADMKRSVRVLGSAVRRDSSP